MMLNITIQLFSSLQTSPKFSFVGLFPLSHRHADSIQVPTLSLTNLIIAGQDLSASLPILSILLYISPITLKTRPFITLRHLDT